MPRTNANGLELSFHIPTGRFYKSGKQFPNGRMYFGSGRSATDREGYRKALEKYNQWRDSQADARRKAEGIAAIREILAATDQGNGPMPSTDLRTLLGKVDAPEFVEQLNGLADDLEKREIIDRAAANLDDLDIEQARQLERPTPQKQADPTPAPPTPVSSLLSRFLAAQEARHAMGKALDAKAAKGEPVVKAPKQYIGDGRWANLKGEVQALTDCIGKETWDGREATAAKLLLKWRTESEKLFVTSFHKTGTFNNRMRTSRMFIQWAYDNYELDSLPRNVKALCSKHEMKSTAKAIPLDELKIIWDSADDVLKTYMALSLNCGYYAIDISDLTAEMLVDDGAYIDHSRGKTGVHVKYKLWPVTKALIARNRMDKGTGKVFQSRKGCDLVHHTPNRTDAIRQRFEGLVKEKLKWTISYKDRNGKDQAKAKYTWSNIRDTGSTRVKAIAPAFVDLYDAHKDKTQGRFYVDGKMIDTSGIDAVIDQLDTYFALPLPPAPKTRNKKDR